MMCTHFHIGSMHSVINQSIDEICIALPTESWMAALYN